MLENNYDIIVIGAGCGGLSAAVCAAKEGKSVLLLEKGNSVGGFSTSFVRGRFEFEASLFQLCGLSEDAGQGELRRLLEHMNVFDKIDWAKIPAAYRLITESSDGNKTDVVLPFGTDNFINAMERYVPGSRESVSKLFEIGEEIENAVADIEQLYDNLSPKTIRALSKKHGNFVKTAPYSVNEVLNAIGVPQKAIEILDAFWIHFGIDCDRFSFTHYISYLYSYIKYGSFIPADRSSAISLALLEEFTKNGGTVKYNSQVTRIRFKDGSASGVILKDGTEFESKHIICNCSPTTAYAKLIKKCDLPVSAVKRTNARTFGARYGCVYLGLNKSPDELGITDYSTFITESADSAKQYELMKSIDTNNAVRAVCPNIAEPTASPNGTAILCLSTIYTDNCWADIQPENYYNEKDMFAARLIAAYENSTGIIIHNSIEEMEIATPVTFARYTNTPQGVTHGYLADDWDGIIPRIMTEATDCDTKGLRFCGGWGVQLNGLGAAIASGRNTVYATLGDILREEGGII